MAMSNLQAEIILLGGGGNNPGVEVYGAVSCSLAKMLSLDVNQSVYAIDTDGKAIAAGTKTGDVYWITPQGPELGGTGHLVQQFANGASVLAVCFLDTSTLAVADTAGRCLLLQSREETLPEELVTDKRVIYSLFRLDSKYLAGLAVNGDLLIWNYLKKELVRVVEAPVPPEDLMALIRPVYWPAAGVWVWPGREGVIIFYDQRCNEVSSVCSDTKEVYAIAICNEQLLTIGTDGCAKRWCPGAGGPADTFEAPQGIISATSWQQENRTMLLLINNEGKAAVYSLTDMGFELIKSLAGQDYRIAVGPDVEKLKIALQQQKMIRAKKLATQIGEKITQQRYSELENYYSELNKLGYPQVALALQAQEARSKNDFVAELKIYKQLIGVIPHEHPGSEGSLVRYAGLLESAWQLPKACGLYRELADRYLDNKGYTKAVQRLSGHINIIKTDRYVIEPDIPLLSLIESATVLGEFFKGRYLVEAKQPISCGVVLGAGDFVKEYGHLCQEKPQMPGSEDMELRWFSKNRAEQVTTVVFKNEDLEHFNDIELGMKLFSMRLQTVLIPVIMLNAGGKIKGVSKEQYNRAIIEELRHIEDDRFKGWLEMVGRTINHTVRRLITKKRAEKIRQSGVIQC